MPNYKRRFWIVISAAAIWSLFCAWLSFNPHALHALGRGRAPFAVLAGAGILSIFFVYYTARRFPRFAIGLAVLATGLFLYSVFTVAYFLLDLRSVWLDRAFDLGELLNVAAPFVLIWQSMKQPKAEKKEGSGANS